MSGGPALHTAWRCRMSFQCCVCNGALIRPLAPPLTRWLRPAFGPPKRVYSMRAQPTPRCTGSEPPPSRQEADSKPHRDDNPLEPLMSSEQLRPRSWLARKQSQTVLVRVVAPDKIHCAHRAALRPELWHPRFTSWFGCSTTMRVQLQARVACWGCRLKTPTRTRTTHSMARSPVFPHVCCGTLYVCWPAPPLTRWLRPSFVPGRSYSTRAQSMPGYANIGTSPR